MTKAIPSNTLDLRVLGFTLFLCVIFPKDFVLGQDNATAKLIEGHLRYGAGPVRGPVHGRVVDHDDVSLAGHVDIELEAAGTGLHRELECLDGVLRGQGRGAPVCQVDGPLAPDGPLISLPHDQGYKAGQPCEGDQDEVPSAHGENLA